MSNNVASVQAPAIERVVVRLRDLILKGELKAGDRLVEHALADALGVGRGPLREAIRTLEGSRLLHRTPNSGVRVTTLTADDVEQILRVREALEGMACRQAAENMTSQEIASLRALVATLQSDLEHDEGHVFRAGADHEFHRQIAVGSRNKWLALLLCDEVYSLLSLYRLQPGFQPGRDRRRTLDEHRHIIECIQARNPETAEAAMRSHVRNGALRMLGRPLNTPPA